METASRSIHEINRIHAAGFTLLNTSIITAFGEYSYQPITLEDAIHLTHGPDGQADRHTSAIGHEATAQVLTELLRLNTPIAVNRVNYQQQPGQVALVFKLKGRAPEGCILNREQIEAMGYEFGLLTRTK